MDAVAEHTDSNQNAITDCLDPIFVLGIMPRCGTNFFYNLLCLHPHCYGVSLRDMPEDTLLFNADLLRRYTNTVSSFWSRHGLRGKDDPVRQQHNQELTNTLFESLGEGLLSYLSRLNPDAGRKPLVTRTPFVRNVKHVFHLFPRARVVILVRDGRAVVESNAKSFGVSYEVGMHRWADAAQEIIEFDQMFRGSGKRYRIVRYEDLLDHLETEMTSILEFLELDASAYDFTTACHLPVFGSSENYADVQNSGVDDPHGTGWKVVQKDQSFNPKTRWSHWSQALHHRFNWIAGDMMMHFNYDTSDEPVHTRRSDLRNRILDAKWAIADRSMAAIYELERKLYAFYLVKRRYRALKMEDKHRSHWVG